jgi:hypothetical protein
MKLPPLNRIVAFAGPYISLLSGAAASWLVVNIEVLGSLHLGQSQVANGIAYVVTAALGAAIPHLGMQKWLDGHQKFTSELLGLVNGLPEASALKAEVIAKLPAANGDILAALTKVISPAASAPLGPGTEEAKMTASGDGSGDVEQPNELIDVAARSLDPVPAPSTFGDDAVHAPPGPAAVSGEAAPQ